jgi:hypothetical protein
MKKNPIHIFLIVLLPLMFPCSLIGQTWTYIKEKDGVKLYTRQEVSKGLKLFKGVADISVSADKVFAMLEDVNHTEWWTKDVSQIKVLHYEKDKLAQCYLVYNVPWPFKDRDLCVNVTATINRLTGERKLTSVPLIGILPEQESLVRIKDYKEEWTVRPIDNHKSHIELEFYVNPGSNLPNWLLNMVLGEAPINVIRAVKNYIK